MKFQNACEFSRENVTEGESFILKYRQKFDVWMKNFTESKKLKRAGFLKLMEKVGRFDYPRVLARDSAADEFSKSFPDAAQTV